MCFKTVKSTAAYKQNVFSVYLNKLLLWVLTAALRRNVGNGALDYFKKCLLYTLAAYIARYAWVFAFTGNFIYSVYIDNTLFGVFNIKIGSLYKL